MVSDHGLLRCVRRGALSVLLAALSAATIAGCEAAPAAADDATAIALGTLPEDFALVAIVRLGPDAALGSAAHLRPARFVVLPDGTLHYAPSAERGEWIPEPTRTLTRPEMVGLFTLVDRLGFADADSGELPVNVSFVTPPTDGLVYVIACSADGSRRVQVRPAPDGADLDPAAVELVRRLAALAWVSDEPDPDTTVLPRRYDLGPDPYERFRRP